MRLKWIYLTAEAQAKNAPLEYCPSEEIICEHDVDLLVRPKVRRKIIRRTPPPAGKAGAQ